MPETRLERAVFVLGLLAMAALALFIARSWHQATATAATAPPAKAARTQTPTVLQNGAAATAANSKTARSRTRIDLALTASHSATWIEVRAGSARGAVLYTGALASGQTKAFRRPTIWVRFGAASNITAQLNGVLVRLPAGTYDAVFDPTGFRRVRR